MTTDPETPAKPKRLIPFVLVALVSMAAAIGAMALFADILEKKEEARNPYFRVVKVDDDTEDPAIWGRNFPLQYDLYKKTSDMVRTRFGGSEATPRTPTGADPRSVVAQSRLEADPRLVTLWAGYAFSKDFREERGHAYTLDDQMFTERQIVAKQPGACIHCHASVYVPYKKAGGGDIVKGFEHYNPMPYAEAKKDFKHPVACIDCHDAETLELRVTRPGFIEGIRALKASQGVADYDVRTMATRQEMRSFVCGQCHVEYYFKGDEKRLTYPWANGLKIEDIQAYYDSVPGKDGGKGFYDWRHAESGALVLKAQHPEFELWNQGIHARSGVSCADCHMPYLRVGAQKISDHHVRSPLLNINRACQTCHKWSEAELKDRAETIQQRVFDLRNKAMDALVGLIADIKAAKAAGRPDAELDLARDLQRKAQFRLDFIEAENSMGFHAPAEAERILFESVDYARQGQIAVRDAKFVPTAPLSGPKASELPAPAPPK